MTEKVSPVPQGFHTITPQLVCRNAAAAIEFYKKAFQASELTRNTGPDVKTILHAELKIGDSIVIIVDEIPSWNVLSPQSLKGNSMTLQMYVENVDEVFQRAVAAGAKATLPVMDTFWGDRYGQVLDPFSHSWAIATRKRNLSAAEIQRAGEEFFAAKQR